jgi:hypothetical protein
MGNREPKVHVIDGVTYVEVDRKAKIGEKVLVSKVPSDWETYGEVYTVSEFDYDEDLLFEETDDYFTRHGDYVVLEPLESEEVTVDSSQASEQVIEMLANLARRVTSLERQLADTQRNLETFAEQTESNSEDIRTLDERTQVVNAIMKFYEGSRR